MKLKCLVIDDEPLARRVIQKYADNLPFLEIIAHCDNPLEAIEIIHQQQVDIIFLDIQMPKLTGIDFLKTIKKLPPVIVTTAYAEFALQGFELDEGGAESRRTEYEQEATKYRQS